MEGEEEERWRERRRRDEERGGGEMKRGGGEMEGEEEERGRERRRRDEERGGGEREKIRLERKISNHVIWCVHEKPCSMYLYMTLFEYCLIAVRNRVGESGWGTLCPETLVQQDAT